MMHTVTAPVVSAIEEWLEYAAKAFAMGSGGLIMYADGIEDDEGLYRAYYSVVPVGSSLEPTNNASSYLSVAHAGVSNNDVHGRSDKFHTINFIIQSRAQGISIGDRDFVKAVIGWGLAAPSQMHFSPYSYVGIYRIQPESSVYFDKSSQTYISRVSMRFLLC